MRSIKVLLIACALIGEVAHANDRVRVGKSQGSAWTFLPLDIGVEQGFFAKQGIEIEIADLAGDAKLQQAFAADGIDFGLGSGPGMAFAAKGSPAFAVAAFAGPPRNIPRLSSTTRTYRKSLISKERRSPFRRQGRSATGWPNRWRSKKVGARIGSCRAIGRHLDQHRRPQDQAGRCRGAGNRSRVPA